MVEPDAAPRRRKIALALQGGGSHGAFTWGVLDRILDDPTIEIIGVTGTSAGAMNAAALVGGLLRGGAKQARVELRRYWEAVGAMPGFGSFFSQMSGAAAAMTPLESIPAYVELMSRNLSPYDLPPSRTVEIDGEPYWDGGWTGNPALVPLIRKMPDCDLIMVRVDPVSRPEVPRSLHDIYERSTEIGFNSTLWLELGVLAAVLRLVEKGLLDRARFGRIRFHDIEATSIMEKFPMSSKRNNYPPLLEYLFDLGRQAGDAWIAEHRDALGQRSTIDLERQLPVNVNVWGDF